MAPTFPLKLTKHLELTGTITLRSGTRIGAAREELEIGGMDNPVIRDPVTREPYIPGSSLKGKFRSTLEYIYGKSDRNGQPCTCAQDDCPVCVLCGPHRRPTHDLGPSRLIFRDAVLTEESRRTLQGLQEQGLPMVEVKSENMIDRRTGVAQHPRSQERVPAGTSFHFNLTVRLFDGDDEAQIRRWLQEGLDNMQKEYLGGSGTRGYGWFQLTYQIAES